MASTPTVADPERGSGALIVAAKPKSNRWRSCKPVPPEIDSANQARKELCFGRALVLIRKIWGWLRGFARWATRCVLDWALVGWLQAKYSRAEATYPGWELGVVTSIAITTYTLYIHIIFLVVVSIKFKPRSNGLGTLWEGECNGIDWVNKVVHAVISMLSTILIAQSNYCLQVLASPTRNEIDIAHKNREWVDIGIPSFRNVWRGHIGRRRIVCWVLLVFASFPLYLLWNSVIIFSPIAYQYNQLTVTNGFVNGLPFDDNNNNTGMAIIDYASEGGGACWPDNLLFLQKELHTYERLENNDCKRKYAQFFLTDRSDVVVVTQPSTPDLNRSTVLGGAAAGWGPWPYQWLCPPESRQKLACSKTLQGHDNQWRFPNYGGPAVEYCLSKKMDKKCRLEYGFKVACLTVGGIALKLTLFIATYQVLKRGSKRTDGCDAEARQKMQPIITTGDAIASFLEFEDKTTLGMSTVEKKHFENGIWEHDWVDIRPMLWRERRPCCRFRAIGVRRWLTGMIILFAIPLFPLGFLLSKYSWLKDDLSLDSTAIRNLGLGNPSGLFLFGVWNGDLQTNDSIPINRDPSSSTILRNIVASNTPQLALAFAYYIWNSQALVMITAKEYDSFAASPDGVDTTHYQQPKRSLRMTYAREGTEQRNSHFFTIPLRYWIPMTALWTLLQWLASQTIFFARLDLLSHWLKITEFSISQVGYSVLGMICFFVVSLVVFLWGAVLSCKNIDNRMPLAATCSAALSAACHPRHTSLKHFEKKIHWGVERQGEGSLSSGLQRCTFTSLDARYPTFDEIYA